MSDFGSEPRRDHPGMEATVRRLWIPFRGLVGLLGRRCGGVSASWPLRSQHRCTHRRNAIGKSNLDQSEKRYIPALRPVTHIGDDQLSGREFQPHNSLSAQSVRTSLAPQPTLQTRMAVVPFDGGASHTALSESDVVFRCIGG